MWLKTEPQNIFLRKFAYFFELKAELSIFFLEGDIIFTNHGYLCIFCMYFLEKEEMKYTTQEEQSKISALSRER